MSDTIYAEPKEVYCSMASRTCFANGKEVAWCLTCPHISEEDRELMKKAVEGSEPKTDEENELKFYYVESIDDYWIGQRLDNFYYADWHDGLGFVWSKSRYLPWGEHVVNEQTLWKEHTYPSEPKEIPFTIWIVGFLEKHSADRPRWIPCSEKMPKEKEIVLITNDKGNVRFGQFRGTHGKYWIWKGNTLETVLAWMPLPKPWKGADDDRA